MPVNLPKWKKSIGFPYRAQWRVWWGWLALHFTWPWRIECYSLITLSSLSILIYLYRKYCSTGEKRSGKIKGEEEKKHKISGRMLCCGYFKAVFRFAMLNSVPPSSSCGHQKMHNLGITSFMYIINVKFSSVLCLLFVMILNQILHLICRLCASTTVSTSVVCICVCDQ